ncbi:sulfatase-like hydrolase/transferase [Litorivicinus sp.]|nr:sulfatase-like hydrolase/transferase [Litorivicinus sp.]
MKKYNFIFESRSSVRSVISQCLFNKLLVRIFSIFIDLNFFHNGFIARIIKSGIEQNKNLKSEDDVLIYGKTSRRIVKPSGFGSFNFDVPDGVIDISFGLAPLESILFYIKRLRKHDFLVKVSLVGSKSKILKKFIFLVPVDYKKHGIARTILGQSWYDLRIDNISKWGSVKSVRVDVETSKLSFTALGSTKFDPLSRLWLKPKFQFCIISKPIFWNSCNRGRHDQIFIISCESMTDPRFFMSKSECSEMMPNFTSLVADSMDYSDAVSAVDSTLPFMASFLTGKLPSAHRIGDYSVSPFEHRLSKQAATFCDTASDHGYHTVGMTSYGRLGHYYGWSDHFDEYFNTDLPFNDDAPNANSLLKKVESLSEVKCLFYMHLTRLHVPFMSTDVQQRPCILPAQEIDRSICEDNFLDLYKYQFKALDYEIGIFMSYLKNTNRYNDSTIILTGDHGVKMPPNWKQQISKNYDLYEEHIRVPLVMKFPNKSNLKGVCDNPTTTQFELYNTVSSLMKNNSEKRSSFYDDLLGNYSVSQTIFHPNRSSLSVCIRTKEFKYWVNCLNAVNLQIGSLSFSYDEEMLFKKNENGFVEDQNNLIRDDALRQRFRDIVGNILERDQEYKIRCDSGCVG